MQKSINKNKRKKQQIETIRKVEPTKPKLNQKVTIKNKKISSLPGISKNFWSTDNLAESKKIIIDNAKKASKKEDNRQKKQRLTGSERYQRYIEEEERIRNVEEEMSNPNFDPHTPDQFERALMNDKNSSFMWIKYMAFREGSCCRKESNCINKFS